MPSKAPKQPYNPYSIHDLDKQKTLLVTRLKMEAEFNPMVRVNYQRIVSDALVAMYKRHAKITGNLNKYKGHDGTPGYRNPHYLWDHLTLNADGIIETVEEKEARSNENLAKEEVTNNA